jgi:hypothetical protein
LCDIATLSNSVADVLSRCSDVFCKLHCDTCYKFARMAYVAAAAREEEAGGKPLPVIVSARDGPRDCRLARARETAQPEDALLVFSLRPAVYLVEEVDACVGKAARIVLLAGRVEGRVFSVR